MPVSSTSSLAWRSPSPRRACGGSAQNTSAAWKAWWISSPAPFSAHATYTFCKLADISAPRIEGDLATLKCGYTGIAGSGESSHLLELVAGTSEEPVETHPRYKELPDSDFQAIKAFLDAPQGGLPSLSSSLATELLKKKLRGTDSYLASNSTLRETYSATGGELNLATVGTIQAPPAGAPTLPAGANWLLINFTIKQNGGIYEISREFRASGSKGWDANLYTA